MGTLQHNFIGDSPAIAKALQFAGKAARSSAPVLIQGESGRLGGRDSIDLDVREIAATNRHLKSACKRGEFRRDLYYRLNVLPITIPPLRDPREDSPALIRYFISKFGDETEPPVTGIPPEAEAMLRRYDWPGNVRELRNVI